MKNTENKTIARIQKKITLGFKAQFAACPTISQNAAGLLKKVTEKDRRKEITLLSYFFRNSLRSDFAAQISEEVIVRLGIANLAGWIAYKIFDDFLDNEGDPAFISLAIMAHRIAVIEYQEQLPEAFHPFFASMMNFMDESNAKDREISYRPDWFSSENFETDHSIDLISGKSLPHSLGPMTILAHLGFEPAEKEIRELKTFFQHYLAARQLNDDARDWADDLQNNFINPVSARILRQSISSKNEKSMLTLQHIFSAIIAPEIKRDINEQIERAKNSLQKMRHMKLLESTDYLESLLRRLVL